MQLVHEDSVYRLGAGERPNYNSANPILRLVNLIEETDFAAEREVYVADSVQYLIPIRTLELYGPSPPNDAVIDPTRQDDKTDFQKQNVRGFVGADARLSRGLVTVGERSFPFLRISYRGGPDSVLSQAAGNRLGPKIGLWVRVAGVETRSILDVPYNPRTDWYDIELWGWSGGDLRSQLDAKGRDALDRGTIVVAPDLVHGDAQSFARDNVTERYMIEIDPTNTLHPILPLHVEAAWTDASRSSWDSAAGVNHQFEFNMLVRGWENFLGVGVSPSPHGGVGFLEYRNLLSNYGRYAESKELSRSLEAWNFDAFGKKSTTGGVESFMAVDYMDLHVLHGTCGIGLHRHRDNQEAFLMMRGRALMVVGDYCRFPSRERCFEVRTLRTGHLAMLKGGNLHGLVNSTDEDISLFMFGGYD